jgi:hypothetical protein
MSDKPVTETADTENHTESSHGEKSKAFPQRSNVSQWLTYAALVLAGIAVVLAALAYFGPARNHTPAIAQQGGDAKANVCSAYVATRKAVIINTHLTSPNPDSQLAVAANARLALVGGGAYLGRRLAENTAAPADIISAASSLANTIQQLGMNYLTDAPASVLDPVRKDLNDELVQLAKLCS